MIRRLSAFLAAIFASLVLAMPTAGVTGNYTEDFVHPYVGLVVFYDAAGNPTHRCSGTLISPTVFLTAGHCTEGAASAQVWFTPEVTAAQGYPYRGGVTGTPYTHPDFVWSIPNTSDVGIVVLDKRVRLSTYGALPTAGTLDALATQRGQQDVTFTVVGYGLQEVKPTYMADRVRYQGTVQLVNLTSALTDGYNLHASSNPGTGGGVCFGDSGGPVFLGTSNIIVGINSFVLNSSCKGAAFAYRVDIANSLDFIYGFL